MCSLTTDELCRETQGATIARAIEQGTNLTLRSVPGSERSEAELEALMVAGNRTSYLFSGRSLRAKKFPDHVRQIEQIADAEVIIADRMDREDSEITIEMIAELAEHKRCGTTAFPRLKSVITLFTIAEDSTGAPYYPHVVRVFERFTGIPGPAQTSV